MATIDIFEGSDDTTSYRSIYIGILFSGSITGHTQDTVTVGIKANPGAGIPEGSDTTKQKMVLKGTGLKFDKDGKVTAGTITSVDFINKLGLVARLTDSIDAAKIYDAFVEASKFNLTPIFDILFNRVPYLVNGSKYDDVFGFASLGDTFFGNGGNDTLSGHGGNDTIHGGIGDDKLFGGVDDDTIFGDAGNDWLRGDDRDVDGNGDDTMDGGAGDDLFFFDGGKDVLKGGDGTDLLNFLDPPDSGKPFTVDLGKGTVSQDGKNLGVKLSGIEGVVGSLSTSGDKYIGDERDNLFVPGGFSVEVDGKGGHDRLAFYRHDAAFGGATREYSVNIDAEAGTANRTSDQSAVKFKSIESFAGSAYGDTIKGSDRDEEFLPMQGWDTVDGGDGTDMLSFELEVAAGNPFNSRQGAVVDLADGKAVDTEKGQDTLSNIENVTGSTLSDTISGDGKGNLLRGIAGKDALDGRGGDDTLIGGAGRDALTGGTGSDTASYADAAKGVAASLAKTSTNTGDAKGDSYLLVENLAGSAFADKLTGNGGRNKLSGGDGNDVLKGGGDKDQLIGDDGRDTAAYADAARGVSASLAKPRLNTGEAKGDTYSSIENLSGSKHGDRLTGNAKENTLTGGEGRDTFVFVSKLSAKTNIDTIGDFSHADDTIALDDAIFGKLKLSDGHLAAGMFRDLAEKATDENKDARILYDSEHGDLKFDKDGAGKAKAVTFAHLDDHKGDFPSLAADDFIRV